MIVAVLIILAFTIKPTQTLVTLGRQNGTHSMRHNRMFLKELTYQTLTRMTGKHYAHVNEYDFKLILEMHT